MVAFAVYLPWLPTDLARRRRLRPQVPIVLSRREHQAEIVAAACAQAQARGVRPGMSLAHARALLPAKAAFVAPIDDHGVMDALRRFGVALTRWLPIVAIDGRDGVLADATGCERLYRGIAPLVQTIADRVRRWGLGAKVVAAPTYGAAWAIARYADTCEVVVGPDDLAQALDGLPVESLRLEMGVIEQLRAVGLERVGQVRRVGRAALADRYGPELLRRLDQAMGLAPETLTPIRTRPIVRVIRAFEGPTAQLSSIMLAARGLVGEIGAKLLSLERGCRELELTLHRSDLSPLVLTIRVAKATRDAKHLWSLLAIKVESAQLGYGVEGMSLRAKGTVRLEHLQARAWGREQGRDDGHDAEAGRLIDTLNARLGVGRVLGLRANQSHRPEAAFARDALVGLPEPLPQPPAITPADRPSILYDDPEPIRVMLHMPDGPIAMVSLAGGSVRVIEAQGPERLEPEWWRPASPQDTRDYFKVVGEEGVVMWIFRSRQGSHSAWFLHGLWA